MRAKLTPMVFEFTDHNGDRRKSCEKVLLSSQEYPDTLITIDCLVSGDLAKRLYDGETINVEITIEEVNGYGEKING